MAKTSNETKKALVDVMGLVKKNDTTILAEISSALTTAENSAFRVATRCAWLVGVEFTINDKSMVIDNTKKLTPKQVYTKVNKSKATLSRWIKAIKLVIEHDLFNDFNSGKYPFSFDKIIAIFEYDLIDGTNTFDTLFKLSAIELISMGKGDDEKSDEKAEKDTSNDEVNTTLVYNPLEDDSPMVKFSYDGKDYEVHENAMKMFIESYCTIG